MLSESARTGKEIERLQQLQAQSPLARSAREILHESQLHILFDEEEGVLILALDLAVVLVTVLLQDITEDLVEAGDFRRARFGRHDRYGYRGFLILLAEPGDQLRAEQGRFIGISQDRLIDLEHDTLRITSDQDDGFAQRFRYAEVIHHGGIVPGDIGQ